MKNKRHLFQKVFIFMLVFFGSVTAVMSLLFLLQISSQLEYEYESKALAIANNMANSDLDMVVNRDASTIQSRIDQYLEIDGVSYVIVTDEFGRIIADTFVPTIPDEIRTLLQDILIQSRKGDGNPVVVPVTIESPEISGDFTQVSQPILGGVVGFVHVGMSRELIDRSVRKMLINLFGLGAFVFLCAALVAYFFVRSVARPLTELTDYAKKVSQHDFSGSLDVFSDDEIGTLADTMRSMSSDLSDFVEGLEKSVQEATLDLQDAMSSMKTVLRHMADGLMVVDHEGNIIRCNRSLLDMFQLAEPNVQGHPCALVFGREISSICSRAADAGTSSQELRDVQLEGIRHDGTIIPLELSSSVVSQQGRIVTISVLRDITERKKAERNLLDARDELELMVEERTRELSRANTQLMIEVAERRVVGEALRKTENKYRSIFEHAVEGIFQISPDGRYVSSNPALARMMGFDSPEELKQSVTDFAYDCYVDAERREQFLSKVLTEGAIQHFESEVIRQDGTSIWISESARMVRGEEDDILYIEGSVEDITLRKAAEESLRHQAFHDPLTKLPNRMLFLDHLRMAMERSRRRAEYNYAVLYLDLDRFKIINDSLGHSVGDQLLCSAARILEGCARSMDTVARFGGDEFAILLEELASPKDGIRIARRILDQLGLPMNIEGHEVYTTASIGIVLTTRKYSSANELLRDADTAMYRAKEMGKARFKVFNQRMHEQAKSLMELETDLRKAIDNNEFEVFYQPIVVAKTGNVAGFEALVRWIHPDRGIISPDSFIPLAEDTGLIYAIDHFVMQEVISKVQTLQKTMPERFTGDKDSMFINANLSGKHFQRTQLGGQIEQLLKAAPLPLGALNIEVTESAILENESVARESFAAFKRHGVGIAIDDFGTGYSSLSYLQQYPIDTIKIDKSFIAQSLEDEGSMTIVRTIMTLASELNLKVVAEGVETIEQFDFLRDEGCGYIQGYLCSMPVRFNEALELTKSNVCIGLKDVITETR
ncbi:MAG: EAL domain-containing protein [Desulfovibrio sp.]